MTRTEMLLIILSEECNEIGQDVSKALRFGLKDIKPGQDQTNAQRIMCEVKDLLTVVQMLVEEESLHDNFLNDDYCEKKKERIEKWLNYSKEKGII